jgi:hypothetical protein
MQKNIVLCFNTVYDTIKTVYHSREKTHFVTLKFQHSYFTVYSIVGLAAAGSLLYRPAAWQLDWPW